MSKKIMFNDDYRLTRAVLDGRKTMTRRVVKENTLKDAEAYVQKIHGTGHDVLDYLLEKAQYKVGEVVAVAQNYAVIAHGKVLDKMMDAPLSLKKEYCGAGWDNKMFVRADLMPHRIRITNVRIERLQDISEEDCMKEGIYEDAEEHGGLYTTPFYDFVGNKDDGFHEPRAAFAALIDKVSGRGTWERNPFCFCYEFKLVK